MMLGNIFYVVKNILLAVVARERERGMFDYIRMNSIIWCDESRTEDEYKTQNTQHRYHNLPGGHKVNDIQAPTWN